MNLVLFLLLPAVLAFQSDLLTPASIQDCENVPEVKDATYRVSTLPALQAVVVQYSCNSGFYMEGPENISCSHCSKSHHWNSEPPTCHELKPCVEIIHINNGYCIGDDDCCPPGYKLQFECNLEYQLVGPSELTCLNNGTWDLPAPECLSRSCEPLDELPYGIIDYMNDGSFYYDDCCSHGVEAHFTCTEGHELFGPNKITCHNREWSATRPRCKPEGVTVCEDLVVPNSELSEYKSYGDYFVKDDIVFVRCEHGYRINGTDYLECNEDGTWSDAAPSCIKYNCTRADFNLGPHIIVEEFVTTNTTEFPVDSRIYLKCEEGYMLEGASSLSCSDGGWYGKAWCRRIHCGRPSEPEFGWMSVGTSYIGDVASFGCRQGYRLVGSEDRFCLANGVWSGTVARCVSEVGFMTERGCDSPGTPDNGVKMGTYYGYGVKITFYCNPGYRLRGKDTIVCEHNGYWSDPIPACIGDFYYDIPWDVKEALKSPLTEMKNMSDTLNVVDDGVKERALNLNVSGVRHVVYFVIDASSSMGDRDFKKGVALTRAIIKKINVTERGHRVGVITFSNNATAIVQPHAHTTMAEVLEQLGNLRYTEGGTALSKALDTVKTDFDTAKHRIRERNEKLKLSIFLITDGKANLGGSPKQAITKLREKPYGAEVYGIGITTSPDREALRSLVTEPIEDHLFILRDYDSYTWLAEILTNGTIDYSQCGSTHRHNIDTGKQDVVTARIARGEKVETHWPWMVEVQKSKQEMCGGSIISRTWILTAAHCIHLKKSNTVASAHEIKIRLGLTDKENTTFAQEATVKRIVMHEGYNATILMNDIALLELEKNITYNPYIRRICLPPEISDDSNDFYREGKPAFVIGWGEQDKKVIDRRANSILRQAKANIVSNRNCTEAYRNVTGSIITDTMMCAGGYGGGDACEGDSGGPLMQGIAKDEYIWTQVGIVSWGHGKGCSRSKKPGVYTNVAKYRRWINQYVVDSQEARN